MYDIMTARMEICDGDEEYTIDLIAIEIFHLEKIEDVKEYF